MSKSQAIVFCDFDGTITACETFVGALKKFSPTLSAELIPRILSKEVTLREGVRRILESMPSTIYPNELLDFVMDKPIRSGLVSLLDYLDERHIPFVVVSGGLRCLVEAVLEREHLLQRCARVYAVDIDNGGANLRVESKWEDGDELVAKVNIIDEECRDKNPKPKVIVIGDSLTDLNAARHADLVFARDKLCTYMREEKLDFIEWNDFHDIRAKFEQLEN